MLLARARQANVLPGLETDQHQGNDFQRAEHRSQAEHDVRRSREVQVMEGADDAAGKKDDRREHHGARGRGNREQLQPREEERDDHGGEDFEEALHPEMHHPPAPVLGGHQVAALAVHQAGRVKQRDRDAGEQEHQQQRVALVAFRQAPA